MEMGDQYGLADLRQLIAGRRQCFPPAVPQAGEEQFNGGHHPNILTTTGQQQQQHYEMLMLGTRHSLQVDDGGDHHQHQVVMPRGVMMDFCSADSTTTNTTNVTSTTINNNNNATSTSSAGGVCGSLEMETINGGGGGGGGGGENGGNSRWPRQETLTLLEIRSSLDHKFKEANQKGPLWDDVSRIMAEEHGYQRSGKKCREKFENLYKYYKKTKEGKAGRQDGKNYRFFRQLEALYGDATSNPVSISDTHFDGNINLGFQTVTNTSTQSNQELGFQPNDQKLSESLSLSNSSDTSSSEDGDDINTISFLDNDSFMEKNKNKKLKDNQSLKRGKKCWKAKIKDFVDSRMKKLMETQEAWLDKMLKTLQHNEQERIVREEEWRRQETARIDQEHKFWAKERAWFEARDAALMEALQRFVGTELKKSSPEELMARNLHENIENQNENATQTIKKVDVNSHERWTEAEISSLIQLRTEMESRLQQNGCSERGLWEEISAKMCCLGYNWSAKNCQEKWEDISRYIRRTNELNRKRKETSRSSTCPYNVQQLDSIYSHEGAFAGHGGDDEGPETMGIQLNDGPSPFNSNASTTVQDSCFRYMMTEGDNNLWENYGEKLNKEGNQ